MKVLVACEYSGIVRDAFLARGHDAISCDIEPTESPGPHIQGDVLRHLHHSWDLVIAHPPCTYLSNAGLSAFYSDPERAHRLHSAVIFWWEIRRRANTERIAIENPVPHKWAREMVGPYDDIVRPWQFGDRSAKPVCLWLSGLPPLMFTGPFVNWDAGWRGDTAKNRSRFFPGIAAAMADQWGSL